VELDDEVGERCGLLGARRRVADRNDARAALLDDSGIAVELFEERYSCASAPTKHSKPDIQTALSSFKPAVSVAVEPFGWR